MKQFPFFPDKKPKHDAVITFKNGDAIVSSLYFAQNGEMAYLGKMLRKLLLIHIKDAKKGAVLTEQEFKTAVKRIEADFCREFEAMKNCNIEASFRYEVHLNNDGRLFVLPSHGNPNYFENI